MDPEYLLGSVLRQVLTSRGRRKRAHGAMRFLLGNRQVAGMGAMALGGLALQLFQSFQQGQGLGTSAASQWGGGSTPGGSQWAGGGPPPLPPQVISPVPAGGGAASVTPPPLPASATSPPAGEPAVAARPALDAPAIAPDVVRVIRLSISAARADGSFTPQEHDAILAQARSVGADGAIASDLQESPPLDDIVRGIEGTEQKQHLYTIAFAIVRGDERVSPQERAYLNELAGLLGLSPETATQLEASAIEQIASSAT